MLFYLFNKYEIKNGHSKAEFYNIYTKLGFESGSSAG